VREQNLDVGQPTRILSVKRRLLYVCIIYLAFLLALAAVEVVTRLTMSHVNSLDLFVVTSQQKAQVADPTHAAIFEGDPLLLWRLKPKLDHAIWDYTVVSTNAHRLRAVDPADDLQPKAPGALRIVCLGDSVTFGYRVPPVWPDKPTEYDPESLPFPMLLQRELRAANPIKQLDVITMAVPGYSSHQGLAWIKRDIETLKPDLLVVSFGWNDASLSDVPDRDAIRTGWSPFLVRWLIDHSQAFAHVTHWLRSQAAKKQKAVQRLPPTSRVSEAEYLDNMMAICELARTNGAQIVVIAAPYRDQSHEAPESPVMLRYRIALGERMKERGIPFLQVRELTEDAFPANEGWFGERIHPNHMGHRLIASELLKLMRTAHLLGDLRVPDLVP
jgi:lysophospholipase L1-like esterase